MRNVPLLVPFVLLVSAVTGCTDRVSDTILAPTEQSTSTAASEAPFYYYSGNRIPLTVDRRGITVAGGSEALEHAREAARAAGAPAPAKVPVDHLPGQGVVRFAAAIAPEALDRVLSAIRKLSGVSFVSPLYRDEEGGEVRLWNRLIVEFEPNVSSDEAEAVLGGRGAEIIQRPEPDSARFTYWVAYPPGVDALEFAADLYQDSRIRYAEPDRTSDSSGPLALPSDPYYSLQWHLSNSRMLNGVHVDDNVEPVWAAGNKGGGVPSAGGLRIAIIDDGVDASHTELDVTTWSAYDAFGRQGPGCTDCATNPRNNDTHGTSVAGIAAAEHNSSGVAGIAPDAQITVMRIYRCTYAPFCPGQDLATNAQVAYAIDWAWQVALADVLNNSWRWPPSDAIRAAILRALSQGRSGLGSVVVFAAGNTSNRRWGQFGEVTFPANLASTTNVISVSSVNRYGSPTNYAPQGNSNRISLVAMSGHDTGNCVGEVVTTDLSGGSGCNDGPTTDYTDTFSGTSAAAPQVAGIAAMVLTSDMGLTAGEVKSRLRGTAVDWGRSDWYGAGKVDAAAAVAYTPPPPPPLSASIQGPDYVPRYSECLWEARVSGGTPPYTYRWLRNSSQVSTTPFYFGSTGGYSFSLDLEVTDGDGTIDTDGLWIQVGASGECAL